MRHIPLAGALRGPSRNNGAPSPADICSSATAPSRLSASSRRWGSVTTTKAVALGLAIATGIAMLSLSPAFASSPPTVTGISPTAGPLVAGTVVTITGTNFVVGSTTAKFGTVAGTSVSCSTTTTCTATSPTETAGTVDLLVTTSGGTSTAVSADHFTYDPVPVISALSRSAGGTGGTDVVTITGTGFVVGSTSVKFGTVAGTSVSCASITSCTATSPAQGAGMVNLRVTTPGGTNTPVPADQFTYDAAPTINAVSPDVGPPGGGTVVTFTGTGFADVNKVLFGSYFDLATAYTVSSDTQLSATSPAFVDGVVGIVVLNEMGGATDPFLYDATPTISGISPSAGGTAGNDVVTITGTGFTDVSRVSFGQSVAAAYTTTSDGQIVATSPEEGAGVVDITVTNVVGTSSDVPADQFTYDATPTISGISPSAGSDNGGDVVTITGTGFATAGSPGCAAWDCGVSFGQSAAASYTVNSDTQIIASSTEEGDGEVDITVTNETGTSSEVPADQFTYDDMPIISGISPPAGGTGGGDVVTITGTGFATVGSPGCAAWDCGVSFGQSAAAAYTVSSDAQIIATSPAYGAGVVDITVTNETTSSFDIPADQFTYDATPTISGISRSAGGTAGNDVVTMTGTGFTDASRVSFGQSVAAAYTATSDTQIIATSPAHGAGVVDITVTNETGTSSDVLADKFTYDATPTISAISPSVGPTGGGTVVSVSGTGFADVTGANFNGTAAKAYTIGSDTSMSVTSPAHAAGMVNLTITNEMGTSSDVPADQFTYDAVPVISALSFNNGPPAGGTVVIITGTGFVVGSSTVMFGTVAGTSVSCTSTTSCTATSPMHSAGSAYVSVSTPGGTSNGVTADIFAWDSVPVISALSSNNGALGGGTNVAITGTGFVVGSTTVMFGTVAGSVSCTGDTNCMATSPAQGAGMVNISVTTPGGTSSTVAADQFTYQPVPVISALSPNSGAPGGATVVTITGTGFVVSHTTAKFGTVAGTSVSCTSTTNCTATSPAQGAGVVNLIITTPGGTSTAVAADQFTYAAASVPIISAISPSVGGTGGTDVVTITGTGFVVSHTTAKFGTVAGTSVSCTSTTNCTATSPAESAGQVNVTVTTPGGTSTAVAADQFTYDATPTISAISPTSGPLSGTSNVNLTGTGFADARGASLSGTAATYTISSDTSMSVTAPAHSAAVVDITVSNETGTSSDSPADYFSYDPVPVISGLSRSAGGTGGTDVVSITGTGFVVGSTSAKFGTVAAASVSCTSTTSCTATSPAESAGVANLSVSTPGGTSSTVAADQFTYDAAPTVSALSPEAGPLGGGTVVSLSGTGLADVTGVYFNGTAATVYSIGSDSSMSATSPAGTGVVDVTVTNETSTSTTSSADQFSYDAVPTVSGLSRNAGRTAGGDVVTITGTGFVPGETTASFGTGPAISALCSATSCSVTVPSLLAGPIAITVSTPGGTSTDVPADQFTSDDAPTVSAVSPSSGPPGGGTLVNLAGTGLADATGISFNNTAAETYLINSDTSVTATSPAGTGVVDITVTNETGTSPISSADEFSYAAAPSVSAVSPSSGSTAGGDVITITGTGFVPGSTSARFGLLAGSSVSCASTTTCTATSPALAAGVVDVTVTTLDGTSTVLPADEFTVSASAGPILATDNGPVVAADNGSQANVTFGVTAGDRTATLTGDVAFPVVNASHSDVDATPQPASIEVNDLSASDAGWDVTILASDLTGPNGATIAAGNLSVASYGALASISGATTNIQTSLPGPIGSATTLLSAATGSGVGDYTQAFDVGLVLPADSLAGNYAGTLTVTIAPPI